MISEIRERSSKSTMDKQILRDKHNRRIGVIETDSKGIQTIRTPSNKKLGTYNPKTDQTRDTANHLIGKGNLLITLLNKDL